MKYMATEYLQIDLDREAWECRRCHHELGSARENFKKFTRIYPRNPQEVHRPKLNPDLYEFTFSPDPKACVIYEFYCPGCGTMMDVEYTVPGQMPLYDFELDLDSLKQKLQAGPELQAPGAGLDVTPALRRGGCEHRHGDSGARSRVGSERSE